MSDPTSSMPPPPVAGFQSASSLLKTQNTNSPSTSSGSLRNASGGQPPIPIPVPDLPGPSSASTNGNGTPAQAQTGPSTSRPINRPAAGKNSIIYNSVQKRNPVLGSIKNVSVEIGDIVADYQVGAHNGVLFLSLKYHRLHPEYIHQRIEKMKGNYNLRIILVLCDVAEHQQSLRELNKIAIINEYTVFVAWSNEEIAQYLTCFKSFEHKSADSLKERVQQTYHDQLQHVLTSGRKVNKTDADNLAAQFGSFANISRQPSKILSNVKGLGATKVTSLVDAFNKPFLVGGLKTTTDTTASRTQDGSKSNEKTSENIGSPDWPVDEEDEEEQGEEEEAIPGSRRGRRHSPSRSPGLSPEPGVQDVWQDPLDLEDEDGEPSSKRVRVD